MTTKQLSEKTGVSLRMLQWWDEHGIASPVIRAHRREYNETEVRTIELVQALRKRGIGLFTIRKALAQIQGAARDLAAAEIGGPSYLVWASGHNGRPEVRLEFRPERVVEFAAKVNAAVTVIEVAPTAEAKTITVDLRKVAEGVGEALRKDNPFERGTPEMDRLLRRP